MSGPLEDDHCHVLERFAFRLGDDLEIVFQGGFDIDLASRCGSNRDFIHVHKRPRIVHGIPGGDGHGGDGIQEAVCQRPGPVDGVNSQIDFGVFARADNLAIEEHGCFILFTFTDHHYSIHIDGI